MRSTDDRGLIFGAVDPDFGWETGDAWWSVDEPFWRALIRQVHRCLSLREDRRRVAVMHGGWCQKREPRMTLLFQRHSRKRRRLVPSRRRRDGEECGPRRRRARL